MATINIVSTSSAKTSRKDECIQKLSDIQSDFDTKIVKLHATKEDHIFFQICQELGQNINSYNDEMKDCNEGDFIYIYDAIKKMLKDELTKTPNYIKCIKKLMPDIKKQVQREKETKDSHNEENSFKETVIQLEEEVNKILEIADRALETEQLEKQDPIPGEPRISVLDHGAHKSEEIDTKDKSTLDYSENVATYFQQN
ncbi:PIR Superfamily Protein [Plasmodium ovale curtisi]|uniref:PIR Superfamily Protein n=1 Tax=Plasmodium ovale curtisi TaxID=864141 RepID=A0A1A8WS06_PLAOA|nr:PIR Superfamily Protein [Plasmodium ovale curtisi]